MPRRTVASGRANNFSRSTAMGSVAKFKICEGEGGHISVLQRPGSRLPRQAFHVQSHVNRVDLASR